MIFQYYDKSSKISPYVKCTITISNDAILSTTNLPFLADGFPSLMYHNTLNGMKITPYTKPITNQSLKSLQVTSNGLLPAVSNIL